VIEPDGRILSLNEAWGPVASAAGCAHAVVQLAAERLDADGGVLLPSGTASL
jgi:hypothetical protein